MPVNPVEAEAIGQEFIAAEFGGKRWTIPLDVDSWPIDQVLNSIKLAEKNLVKPNHFSLLAAISKLLGDQWAEFRRVATKRRDLVTASHEFAAAVGLPREKSNALDVAFGSIPRLLLDVKLYPDAVEAALADLGIDYRDRWRFDAGRRRLTLRQIHVRLRNAPYDNALRRAKNNGRTPFSNTDMLLMDVYERLAGQAHPWRPLPAEEKAKREASKSAHDEYRKRQQRRRSHPLTAAADVARANAQRAQQREVGHAQDQRSAEVG